MGSHCQHRHAAAESRAQGPDGVRLPSRSLHWSAQDLGGRQQKARLQSSGFSHWWLAGRKTVRPEQLVTPFALHQAAET